jgi:hypothetical protein
VKAWWDSISSRPAWKEVHKFAAASPTGFELLVAGRFGSKSLADTGKVTSEKARLGAVGADLRKSVKSN